MWVVGECGCARAHGSPHDFTDSNAFTNKTDDLPKVYLMSDVNLGSTRHRHINAFAVKAPYKASCDTEESQLLCLPSHQD
jgi:hypothetical protein